MKISAVPTCLAVHDLSCVGRCSLTAVIPVLAALGVQAIPLPTTLYSNHLGFAAQYRLEMTTQTAVMDAWDQNGIRIDSIYSGFLASPSQIGLVRDTIRRYGAEAKYIIVDPAMADHGTLYKAYDDSMVLAMRRLITHADILLPNWTEACMLAAIPYTAHPDPARVRSVAQQLAADKRLVIITSVPVRGDLYANILHDGKTGDGTALEYPHLPLRTGGTGDLFAAAVTGLLLRGQAPADVLHRATDFVTAAVKRLAATQTDPRYGVPFECELYRLLQEVHHD